MEELRTILTLIGLVLLFSGIGVGIVLILNRLTKIKYIKYLPAIIPLGIIIYSLSFLYSGTSREGFADLAFFLNLILFCPSAIAIIITSLIIDLKRTPKN